MRHIKKPVWIVLCVLLALGLATALFFLLAVAKTNGSITLYGNVDVRQVDIGFRVYGKITEMPFEEGDFVASGDFMACIDSQPYADQVEKAYAQLQAAQFSLANAEQIFARRQELVGEGGVSLEDYENAKT
ncbi:MAG TPA: efflux RND transporter periplasmic adaptor subunit, partial [Parachlamydiales bacterium]|nr:efflux RND transporter periplasmic adaptor subunit [Parachlamydiales bacterium]